MWMRSAAVGRAEILAGLRLAVAVNWVLSALVLRSLLRAGVGDKRLEAIDRDDGWP